MSIFDIRSTGEPIEVDARKSAGVQVTLVDTGTGEQGRVLIGKYKGEPETTIKFLLPEAEGGTGKKAIKFVDVYVEGISGGTAEITIDYDDEEIAGFDENSLFLSFWNGKKWQKAENITVFSGANRISGEIQVRHLTGTIIGIGGAQSSAGIGGMLSWIIMALVIVGAIIVITVKKKVKQ
jgi:hypothetical protein